MRFYIFFFSLIASLSIASCVEENSNSTTTENTTIDNVIEIPSEAPTVYLGCRTTTNDEADAPHYDLYFYVADKKTRVAEADACKAIEKIDYERYHIPKNATMAVGGYYAGLGNCFYITIDAGNPIVWQVLTFEETPDKPEIKKLAYHKEGRFGRY